MQRGRRSTNARLCWGEGYLRLRKRERDALERNENVEGEVWIFPASREGFIKIERRC